jgi:hypothetical protein
VGYFAFTPVETDAELAGALNLEIFETMNNEYYRDPDTFVDTLNAVIVEAGECYSRRCAVKPSISKERVIPEITAGRTISCKVL